MNSFIKKALAATLICVCASPTALWAWNGYFRDKGVRESFTTLVRAFEDQDVDALRMRISEEFLLGNPEIMGRVRDAFDRFDKTRMTYKIAAIQVADGIASMRVNWTKTSTDRMNNWTYRDIGNDVVMHFSAVEPYQLVGLQEANLFGVSFLLQTRIVITAPALAKLELDRKRLEIEERKLALEESRDEQSRVREAQSRMRARAREEVKTHQERMEQQFPAVTSPAAGPATTPVVAPPVSVSAAIPVSPAVAVPPAPGRTAPASAPVPAAVSTSPSLWAVPVPQPLPESGVAVTADAVPEDAVVGIELTKDVREKAESEALALLARRRMIVPTEEAPVLPPGYAPPVAPVAPPPEVEAWRQAALREIREKPAVPSAAPPVTLVPDEPLLSADGVAEARRQAAVRARRLAAAAAAAGTGTSAPPRDVMADIRQRAVDRAEVFSMGTAPATDAVAAVPPAPVNLLAIEQATKVKAEIREKAEADALKLMQARAHISELSADTDTNLPVAILPVRPVDDDQLAVEVRDRAEQEARRLLMQKAAGRSLFDDLDVPMPDVDDQAAIPEPPPPAEVFEVVEVSVARPGRAVPQPAVTEPALPPASAALPPPVLPSLCLVKGGEQPDGPAHDFYMAAYEVVNQEFCRFLNAARSGQDAWAAQNMYFDADGNVFMDGDHDAREKIFSVSNMDFNGTQAGIRYFEGAYLPVPGRENHPVTGVSWYGALKYCNWLTMASGLGETNLCYAEGPNPSDWHPDTITSHQWEKGFAASQRQTWVDQRGGFRLPMNEYNSTAGPFNEFYLAAAWDGIRNTVYAFGRDVITGADANYLDSGYPPANGTTPAGFYDGSDHGGVFRTNPDRNHFGLHDLSGNVWEWSNDTTGNIAFRALYGGSWRSDADSVKAVYRGSISPHNTADHVGFRVIVTRLSAPP